MTLPTRARSPLSSRRDASASGGGGTSAIPLIDIRIHQVVYRVFEVVYPG